jgi:hypothetical protein
MSALVIRQTFPNGTEWANKRLFQYRWAHFEPNMPARKHTPPGDAQISFNQLAGAPKRGGGTVNRPKSGRGFAVSSAER